MTSAEIREHFLKFFEKHQHKRVVSSSLIPAEDPTLYFTNAGMVPFKDYFTGAKHPSFVRATSSQKCLRVSGKHNDLENVGRTPRHHTFFEMLGNFSFGDYFKREAIGLAWEFLTKELKIPREKLWITIYQDDEEAGKLWQEVAKIPASRILRLGEKDNFWSMGETGPCGPCSEIHYDHGEKYGCGKRDCGVTCECGRFMEVWNLVFMQFERDTNGKRTSLPRPSIDTGMGLERLAAVVQGVHSNYDTDLFTPIIREIEHLTGKTYCAERASGYASASGLAGGHGGEVRAAAPHCEDETSVSIRVLADHIRAATFLIADGVHPSNEGRGYVLRRIMRRAIRHGKLLEQEKPFFWRLSDVVVKEMGKAYPEIVREKETLRRLIRAEEEKFLETLEKGLVLLEEEIARVGKRGKLPGEVVFRLYDTYGFPTDLTELIAAERRIEIDQESFDREMEAQKTRGRKAWKGSAKSSGLRQLLGKELECTFVGYDRLEGKAPVVALVREGKRVDKIKAGDEAFVVTTTTPFYPEGGGQVGDRGRLEAQSLEGEIQDTQKGDRLILHKTSLLDGKLQEGDEVTLRVDPEFREGTMVHHSATHLMHAALRNVLGKHVRQAGSLVESGKLRFDFTHFEAVKTSELRCVEEEVNGKIFGNLAVSCEVLPYDEAIRRGALAFFEEKYGDKVRVVKMGDYSVELCGGTHVSSTGDIGLFKITGESSVAAGVRRIEAVVGQEALRRLQQLEAQISGVAGLLKVAPGEVAGRVEKLLTQVRDLERALDEEKRKKIGGSAGGDKEEVREVKGIKILASVSSVGDAKLLREVSDRLINKLGKGIVAVGTVEGDRVSVIVRVSKDLTGQYHAGDLIRPIAELLGGKGGGRPDMAQAGGTRPQDLLKALQKIFEI